MVEQTSTESNGHTELNVDEIESRLDAGTAQAVYDELGHQINVIDNVLEEYHEQRLEHTDSYEQLQTRSARFRKMRGLLQSVTDEQL